MDRWIQISDLAGLAKRYEILVLSHWEKHEFWIWVVQDGVLNILRLQLYKMHLTVWKDVLIIKMSDDEKRCFKDGIRNVS